MIYIYISCIYYILYIFIYNIYIFLFIFLFIYIFIKICWEIDCNQKLVDYVIRFTLLAI